MENTKSPKFNIGDKVVVIPERESQVLTSHKRMTLTVKSLLGNEMFTVEEHDNLHCIENWEVRKLTLKPKYEVGKKYFKAYPGCKSSIYTCVDITLSGIPVMTKGDLETKFPKFLYEGEVLKEYIEPKIHTRYVHWHKNLDGFYCYASLDEKPLSSLNYIKTDVVTYKEEPK